MSNAPPSLTPRRRGMLSQYIFLGQKTPLENLLKKIKRVPTSAFQEAKFMMSEKRKEGNIKKLQRQQEIENAIKGKLPIIQRLFQGGKRTRTYKKQKKLSPKLLEELENVGNILELVEVVGGGKQTRRKAKKFTRRH